MIRSLPNEQSASAWYHRELNRVIFNVLDVSTISDKSSLDTELGRPQLEIKIVQDSFKGESVLTFWRLLYVYMYVYILYTNCRNLESL